LKNNIVRVLFNIRINQKRAERFIAQGIELHHLTKKEVVAKSDMHAKRAVHNNLDPYRGKRVDAIGVKQADSGEPVFGWKSKGIVTLEMVWQNLVEMEFCIFDIHLIQKEGDRMFSLRVTFDRIKNDPDREIRFLMTREIQTLLDGCFDRAYKYLYVYRNPNGIMTINPSIALDPNGSEEKRSLRIMRDFGLRRVKQ